MNDRIDNGKGAAAQAAPDSQRPGLARCGPDEQQVLGAWAQQRTPGIVSESPLEESLRKAFLRTPYRLDFALVNLAADAYIAIEIDGAHHDRPEQAQRDRLRDRALAGAGWVLQRFSGVEVHRDANACAAEIIRLARRASGLLKLGVSA
jgi:very-short-patch-repair endonuclease